MSAPPGGGRGERGATGHEVERATEMTDFSDRLVESIERDDDGPIVELDVDRPDEIAQRSATVRQLAVDEQVWRFGHVIVDEAQDLTPMQWRMVVRRSRRGAVTMLGDLAQRSVGEPGRWEDHLPPDFALFDQRNLTTNYRSPAEINDLSATVLNSLAPDLPTSQAVRHSGEAPRIVKVNSIADELASTITSAMPDDDAGGQPLTAAVLGFELPDVSPVRALDPWRAKGLEFDTVFVVEPARFLDMDNGLSLLYVALTRSTRLLTIIHERPLPAVLDGTRSVDPGAD